MYSEYETTEGIRSDLSIHIYAPIDVVWEVVKDVDSHPGLFASCHEVKRIDEKSGCELSGRVGRLQPGTVFVERRTFSGEEFSYRVSVVKIEETHPDKKLLVTAPHPSDSTGTSSHLLSAIDDKTCCLKKSFALVPDTIGGRFRLWCNRRKVLLRAQNAIESDLRDIRIVSQARFLQATRCE